LNAIAAFQAKIIQSSIRNSFNQLNSCVVVVTARKKPIIAKGIAKTVWANNTSEKYLFIRLFVFYTGFLK